jgi:hypothetical protein
MQPAFPVVLMTINYSHDIATALLASSGAALWMLSRHYPADATPAARRYFLGLYVGITRIAKGSLAWILLAGVPRIIFYTQYEWSDLAGDLQIVAIAIKHVVMFLLVGMGVHFWIKLGKLAKPLEHPDLSG